MYFHARLKRKGKAPVEAPALIALERFVNVKLQDRYYGEDVAGVRVIFCDSADEARRMKAAYVYRVAVDVFAPMPDGADPADPRTVGVFLKSLPKIIRQARRVLAARIDFDLASVVTDVARLRPPARTRRVPASEPGTITVRRALARDRWLRSHPRPLIRPLHGIRIYDQSERSGRPTWWDLAEIVSIALRAENVRTPGYSEIYVNLAVSLEAARRESLEADWAEAAVGVMKSSRRRPAFRELLDASEKAVLARARIDHLDRNAIKRAFARVRAAKDLGIEMLRANDRGKTLEARLIVAPKGNGVDVLARLEIANQRTRTVIAHALQPTAATSTPLLFDSLAIRGSNVELSARDGMRAKAARGDLPRVRRFAIS